MSRPAMVERLPAPPLPAWLEKMLPAGITRYRVEVGDGLRMHVMEQAPPEIAGTLDGARGGARPVLLLHGNPTWGFLYRKVAEKLAGEPLRLIMPDLIGLGFSDKPRDPALHTLSNHARWLGRLIDVLDLSGLIMVGQDWGGPIGLVAAADRPERLAGLVLLNTVVAPPRPGFRPTAFHRLSRVPVVSTALFRLAGFPQIALWTAQGDRRSIRGKVARAYRYPLSSRRENVAPLALARMVPDSLEHPSVEPLGRCRELVERFEGPVAIVWGDRDPVLGRVRRFIEKLLPDATVTVTNAGHFLQEEVPDQIAAAVRNVAAALD